MKKLKKSLAFITTISMLATLAACNSDNKDSSKEESTVETTAEITTEAVTEEETTEAPTEEITEPETTEETTEAPTEINPEEYKSECQDISYSEIARDSNGLAGQYFTFTGKIIQVMDGTYRMNVTVDEWGIYNDTILFIYDTGDGDRILEDDIVTIWGQSLGLYTYTSVLGSEITVPAIDAKYISINNTGE